MNILIKNGRVIDPANKIDGLLDVFIQDDKISKVAKDIKLCAETVIEAAGKIVVPGIIDMHVHLREPGREDKETVASATAAAAKGGVTTVLAMPNTQPAIDSPGSVELLQDIINKTAKINVQICGTLTKGRLGQEPSDIAALKRAGACAFSDDGSSVDEASVMLAALNQIKSAGLLAICHCEDKKLSGKGVINLGFNSTRLGLRGISNVSEYKRIQRDIELAEQSGCPVHIAHVSCRESVEIIAQAKKKGIKVSAETAPHYFALTEDELLGYDTNMKMNPPLRSKEDLAAIRQGLADGTIDVIASDHAPHTENEKDIEFERAEFGVVGLETELSVSITELINNQVLDWSGLIQKFCVNPARILGLARGCLSVGSWADVVVISEQSSWTVDKRGLVSKSRNSAFLGRSLKGLVDYTICNGAIVYRR
ncbi:MAG TPA: dihydroorotase [Candidatus Omnitrophota bacterium]|nr:dihydroorotase [Candidatus Omnitrophota bacterium]HPT39757.1 dihydroorotase [Candidatus Omnitrophota bacterium]